MHLVQVQHSSDHCRDGTWHDLDLVPTEADAIDAMLWFNGWRFRNGHYRQSGMGYAGRPIRYVKVEQA